jgi:hypothetical protein
MMLFLQRQWNMLLPSVAKSAEHAILVAMSVEHAAAVAKSAEHAAVLGRV